MRRRKVIAMYTAKVRIAHHPGRRGSDSRAGVCSPFQNPHLRCQASELFRRLVSLGYNHVVASLLGWRVGILLLAEFKKGHWRPWSSAGSEQSLRTSRLYVLAGSTLMSVGGGLEHRSKHSFDVIGVRSA